MKLKLLSAVLGAAMLFGTGAARADGELFIFNWGTTRTPS